MPLLLTDPGPMEPVQLARNSLAVAVDQSAHMLLDTEAFRFAKRRRRILRKTHPVANRLGNRCDESISVARRDEPAIHTIANDFP